MKKILSTRSKVMLLVSFLGITSYSTERIGFYHFNVNPELNDSFIINNSNDTLIDKDTVRFKEESEIEDYQKFYKPRDFSDMDMLRSDAKWSWFRSAQSEHFILFWEAGFGDNPNSEELDTKLRVNVFDLLEKAELFYKTNVEKLNFAGIGNGTSYLDKYKMQIYLLYQTEWAAFGAGYDNTIGALWVSPSTCQPVGSTIAHEIGHSFQYQVYCDKIFQGEIDNHRTGYRYGFGPNGEGGNSFWEQCAQWQSFQDYPAELFDVHLAVFQKNCHRHFSHEWMRYASYWFPYYWMQKHGQDAVAKVWRESKYPEDGLMTYARIYGDNNLDVMYDDIYNFATRMVTYDIDAIHPYVPKDIKGWNTQLYAYEKGYYLVGYENCLGTSGFNIIPLSVPKAGTKVKIDFQGLPEGSALADSDPGKIMDGNNKESNTTRYYNITGNKSGEFRYGFVAVVNGKTIYEEMNKGVVGVVSYTVPKGTSELYFVVVGSPKEYHSHNWNENELDDEQWPYMIKFTKTDWLGK